MRELRQQLTAGNFTGGFLMWFFAQRCDILVPRWNEKAERRGGEVL